MHLNPVRHVGGKAGVMLMKGTYTGSGSGEVLISDGGKTVTADDPASALPALLKRGAIGQGRPS